MRKLLIGTLAILLVAACAEPKKTRATATTRGERTQTPGERSTPGPSTAGGVLNCTGDQWGVIYADSATMNNWQFNVETFASASVKKSDVGTVSPTDNDPATGISFCGRICSRNTAPAEVYIGIWDSFFPSKFDSEISINIRNSGQNNGRLTSSSPVAFEDDYGSIEFIGLSLPTGVATGTFFFRNKKYIDANGNVVPGDSGRIQLGVFRIRADRFFRTDC